MCHRSTIGLQRCGKASGLDFDLEGRDKGQRQQNQARHRHCVFSGRSIRKRSRRNLYFGLSAGHAHDYLERALTTLNQLPETALETPKELAQRVDNYSDIIIDGVETPCVRPHQEERQKDRYSGKKTPYRKIPRHLRSSATHPVR